ncbi:uncharacterized protein G2W53_025032 [Senna tora]|uniref:Uncharacterized protein n=1 Tax=Senna tora TaxID=362788 RepID=A0A834WED6_9FABA|nr:uncharacterized protein G2W53_025032 [Senna tora]
MAEAVKLTTGSRKLPYILIGLWKQPSTNYDKSFMGMIYK